MNPFILSQLFKMKQFFIIRIFFILLAFLCGCKSIVVGGKGEVGGVRTSGSVAIPIPKNR